MSQSSTYAYRMTINTSKCPWLGTKAKPDATHRVRHLPGHFVLLFHCREQLLLLINTVPGTAARPWLGFVGCCRFVSILHTHQAQKLRRHFAVFVLGELCLFPFANVGRNFLAFGRFATPEELSFLYLISITNRIHDARVVVRRQRNGVRCFFVLQQDVDSHLLQLSGFYIAAYQRGTRKHVLWVDRKLTAGARSWGQIDWSNVDAH